MVTRSGTKLRIVVPIMAGGLTALTALIAPVTLGASEPPPCRVRNITQGTAGTNLSRMVERRSRAGDRLTVEGTCRSDLNGVMVPHALAIRGVGRRPTITGSDRHQILWVRQGAKVILRRLTLEHGFAESGGGGAIINQGHLRLVDAIVQDSRVEGHGGAILNQRRLTVVSSIIRRNRAEAGDPFSPHPDGGGIASDTQVGRLTLRRSVVAGNSAEGDGGGIWATRSSVRLVDSVVRGNRAADGGGIFVRGVAKHPGDLTLVDSVVRGNSAEGRGGGVFNAWTSGAALKDSAVTANAAGIEGGGVFNDLAGGGIVTLDGASSVAGNAPDDCVGTPAC